MIFFFFWVYFSEEEAKKKIYSVSTTTYTGFGALISEELSLKVKGIFFFFFLLFFLLFFPSFWSIGLKDWGFCNVLGLKL